MFHMEHFLSKIIISYLLPFFNHLWYNNYRS
nr:MAG TPA: hypothetical protein [Caudoviricetes sp.]